MTFTEQQVEKLNDILVKRVIAQLSSNDASAKSDAMWPKLCILNLQKDVANL